ncbi:MAG TPA: hypothetical protein VH418_11220, partial [Solirubrobacteraceae bacterium]
SRPRTLCAPAQKNKEPKPANRRSHLACYGLRVGRPFARRTVVISNQLQPAARLRVTAPVELCLPAGKSANPKATPRPAQDLDHFECYKATPMGGALKPRRVLLRDQFGRGRRVVAAPRELCNPVSKNRGAVLSPTEHLVCYAFRRPKAVRPRRVAVVDQFSSWRFTVSRPRSLCVPSVKF